MPITIPIVGSMGSDYNTFNSISSDPDNVNPLVALQAGDLVTLAVVFTDNNPAGTLTPGSTGTLVWELIQDQSANGTCRVAVWWARSASAQNVDFSVAFNSGNGMTWSMFWKVHRGADTSSTPIGASSKGSGASSVSYPITPAGSGSAAWLIAADANAASTATISAGTNCTMAVTSELTREQFSAALIRPTTQPRTDAAAFTLAETHTGSGVSWVGFEVKAADAGGGSSPKRALLLGVG